MHIPDGFLVPNVNPQTAIATGALAAAAVGYSLHKVKNTLQDRTAPLLGVTSACIFAAQMINFPVAAGTSGHLCGGVLAAVLLGPWGGTVAMAVVLIVQCLLFGDGGVVALGANIFNMGVLGSMVGYCVYASLRRFIPGKAGIAAAAVIAAWFSVLLASIACSVELAAAGMYPLRPTLTAMVLVHLVIGIGEALITGLALAFILKTRPDLIYGEVKTGNGEKTAQFVVGGLAIALVIAVFLSPFASSMPDGLEWVAESLGFLEQAGEPIAPGAIPDYEVPGIHNAALATAAAGLIGSLVVFGIAFFVGRSLWLVSSSGKPQHAT